MVASPMLAVALAHVVQATSPPEPVEAAVAGRFAAPAAGTPDMHALTNSPPSRLAPSGLSR